MQSIIRITPATITGEHLLGRDQGAVIRDLIRAELAENKPVVLDFAGCDIVANCALNVAIGELYGEFPRETIRKLLTVENASDVTRWTIRKTVENAVKHFAKSPCVQLRK